jgi:hypothetical protein
MKTFAALLMLVSVSAPAADRVMLKITSSYPDGYTGAISTSLDDRTDRVTGFHFQDSRGTHLDYTVEQMRAGVVLLEAFGMQVIKLRAPAFDPERGGTLDIDFLRRFFGGDRRTLSFDFVHPGSDWDLLTDDSAGRDAFDSLSCKVLISFGTPSGVDHIELMQGATQVRDYDSKDLPKAPSSALVRRRDEPKGT